MRIFDTMYTIIWLGTKDPALTV